MKNLLVFASAVMVGAAAFAGTIPRVYQYSASLTSTLAKNAAKVTYTDPTSDEKTTDYDVCYRVKGKIAVKGVLVFGCDCYSFEDGGDIPSDIYQFALVATSLDKYAGVTFAEGGTYNANRLGNPLSSKAKVAELGLDLWFKYGPTNDEACVRYFDLWNAGFGKAASIENSDELDIVSISGGVVGEISAPFCAASENECPRCVMDGDCSYAIAFAPCAFLDPYHYEGGEWDMAYGTFSLKFNKSYSNLIKPILPSDVQATINALVPKAFGKNAIAPSVANYGDYLWD